MRSKPPLRTILLFSSRVHVNAVRVTRKKVGRDWKLSADRTCRNLTSFYEIRQTFVELQVFRNKRPELSLADGSFHGCVVVIIVFLSSLEFDKIVRAVLLSRDQWRFSFMVRHEQTSRTDKYP